MSAPKVRLLHHLPHLLRRAHFESEAVFTAIYGDAVTPRQLVLLVAVDQRPGASQSQIAQDIGLDLNTCSDLVARTVGKGLLCRDRSPLDARSFWLRLSDDGRRLLEEHAGKSERYVDALAARLSEQEREQLVALLRKLLGFEG